MRRNAAMHRCEEHIDGLLFSLKMLGLVLLALLASPDFAKAEVQTAPADAADLPRTLNIGVLSTEGATRTLEAWTPTVDLLNRAATDQNQPYRFSLQPHTLNSLSEAIANQQVDLSLTDPGAFVAAEVESGARALLSTAQMWQGRTYDMTGALVFARSDGPLRGLEQLQGRRVMAVAPNDFGGWWLAEQEFRKHRIEPREALSGLVFSGGNQREVVYAVRSGLVDAGVVRAGVLEALDAQGVIDLDDFAPISPRKHADFPFLVSTALYPEWVLSALPDVPEPALALVINTLLTVTPDSQQSQAAGGAVWQAPQNYQSVHDLLISLRVRPYEKYLLQASSRIFRTYRLPILSGMALILFSLLFLAYQLHRNIQLAEQRRNVLQSEVRSKKFYRSAIEEHTVFCMLTLDGQISHVNDRFCKTSDRSRQDLVDVPLAALVPERDQGVLNDEIMTSMAVGAPWSGPLEIRKPDGSVAWVQCTCIPVTGTGEQLSEIALVATDMTKTRKGISEDRFNDTLELIEDQVVVIRPGTLEMLYVNKAAEQRLVKDRIGGDWKGKRIENFVTEDDLRMLRMRCDAVIEGPQRRITWEVAGKSGTPYEISLEYVQPDHDEPRLIAIYRDITARKVAEKVKNEFISTVSHELRTPLTSMKGALGLALSGTIGEMPEPMNKMISMASANCDRLVMLINDILDLEKIEAGKMDFRMEPLDVADLIDKAIEANSFYAEKYGVALKLHSDEVEGGYWTLGDRNRLMQVMDNLMSNASKFSPKGGEIIVSLRRHHDGVRISVRDFGSGIPQAAQATIFDKFTQADSSDTRSKGGTGLGLSIAKLIVEEHNGAIFFKSVEKLGTEFFVDLPRLDGEELVPIERFAEGEGATAIEFSIPGNGLPAEAPEAEVQAAERILCAMLRKNGAQVDIETDHANAHQIGNGKDVAGQSSALNWLTEDSRSLLAGLLEREIMNNRNVCVLDVATAEDAADILTGDGVGGAGLLGQWLAEVPGLKATSGAAVQAPPQVMAVADGAGADILRGGVSLATAEDAAQGVALAGKESFDLAVHVDRVGEAGIMTMLPIDGGRLPAETPVIVVVLRNATATPGRGVVSKFARPAGAGRGKARRRAVES